MHPELRKLIDANGGVADWSALRQGSSRHAIDHAVRSGHLRRLHPRTYVDTKRAGEPGTRARAALCYAGGGAALSHLTALAAWRIPGGDPDGPVHITVSWHRRLRATHGIVVHRRVGFRCEAPGVVWRNDLPLCRLERCIMDSWPLLTPVLGRAAVIQSVNDRLTTPSRLLAAVGNNLTLPGRSDLLCLINLLNQGCRSELELWGYKQVFAGQDMPEVKWNVTLRLQRRTIYLDAYCATARVNFELDGARWHVSRADRERDARRDAILAAMGIMVVRFTHDQLVNHPDLVKAQIRAIVATRHRDLTAPTGQLTRSAAAAVV